MTNLNRVIALLIDHLMGCLFGTIITYIVIIIMRLNDDIVTIFVIYILGYCVYMIMKDIVFKNASIGKKIMHIYIKTENAQALPVTYFIKRAVISMSIFPIEILLILFNGECLLDMWTKTIVVKKEK